MIYYSVYWPALELKLNHTKTLAEQHPNGLSCLCNTTLKSTRLSAALCIKEHCNKNSSRFLYRNFNLLAFGGSSYEKRRTLLHAFMDYHSVEKRLPSFTPILKPGFVPAFTPWQVCPFAQFMLQNKLKYSICISSFTRHLWHINTNSHFVIEVCYWMCMNFLSSQWLSNPSNPHG